MTALGNSCPASEILYCPSRLAQGHGIWPEDTNRGDRQGSPQDRRSRHGRGLTTALDFALTSHTRAVLLLIGLCFLAFPPGMFHIPPVDRDEARFAQATKQMIESGDYVDIRFQEESRYKKPVGIYWAQAAVVNVARALRVRDAITTDWHLSRAVVYRRARCGVADLLGARWRSCRGRAALLAAIMAAVSILLGVEARLAKTRRITPADVRRRDGRTRPRLHDRAGPVSRRAQPMAAAGIFWTAMAGGALLKGPLIFMFVALAVVALAAIDRSVSLAGGGSSPALGVLWLILLVLPWFIAIVSRSGWSFFTDPLGRDMFAKVGTGQESHGMPPGFYLVLFWVTFFPGALLAGLAAPAIWRLRKEPGAKFLLAWVVPSWIVFEVVATKRPHYVLPLYPAIAIMIAGVLDHHALSQRLWLVRGTVWWFLITTALVTGAITAHFVIGQQMGLLAWPFAAGGADLRLQRVVALHHRWRRAVAVTRQRCGGAVVDNNIRRHDSAIAGAVSGAPDFCGTSTGINAHRRLPPPDFMNPAWCS